MTTPQTGAQIGIPTSGDLLTSDTTLSADRVISTADPANDDAVPSGSGGVWHRLYRNPSAMFGGSVVIVTTLVAMLATLTTLDPAGLPTGRFGGISAAHPFGVEPQTGRDLFAIVSEGTRTSFLIGVGATVLSMVIAIVVGVTAGYFGGWWDAVASRGTDVILGFPQLVFMIAISDSWPGARTPGPSGAAGRGTDRRLLPAPAVRRSVAARVHGLGLGVQSPGDHRR